MHFVGHVSDEELVAYYEVADLFLCASEHEGFCVPLVEAFYKQVPVLAYAATAVPATMDGAGVLFDDKDPMHVAALMDADPVGRRSCRTPSSTASWRPSSACSRKDFAGTLLGFVDRILRSPRAPAPQVAFDFWHQFDAAEELEELRLVPAVDLQGAAGGRRDRQSVGAGGAQGRRDRRQRAAHARPAPRAWATSPSSTR